VFHAIIRHQCEPRHIRDFYLAVTSLTHWSYTILPASIGPGNRPGEGATFTRGSYGRSAAAARVRLAGPEKAASILRATTRPGATQRTCCAALSQL